MMTILAALIIGFGLGSMMTGAYVRDELLAMRMDAAEKAAEKEEEKESKEWEPESDKPSALILSQRARGLR